MSASLREDALCLDSMRDMFLDGFLENGGIKAEKLNGSPAAVVNRALAYLYRKASGGQSLEAVHIDALKELSQKSVPHSSVSLPCGIRGIIENGRLYIEKAPEAVSVPPYNQTLFEGKNLISQTNCEIIILPSQNAKNVYKNSIISYIDSAKIKGGIYARSRQDGDRILLGGMNKSVKKLMCDKKIPLDVRARLPIICDDEGILVIPLLGVRDGCRAKDGEGVVSIVFCDHAD
jgi:tRNA(Ile)-lysidine synthase